MYEAERPSKRLVTFILVIAAWLLAACGGQFANANWPGLSAEGDVVYVAYGNGVLAYNVNSRSQEWVFSPAPGRLAIYAAPSVTDGRIIVGDYGASQGFFSPGVVVSAYGLRASGDGAYEELWTAGNIASDRIVAPPLQIGGRAFVGTADNQMVALNAETGEVLWRFAAEHSIWAQPSYKEGVLYVTSLDKKVYALDPESGAEIWATELGGAIASQAAIDSDLIYVTSFDRQLHALNRVTGEIVWSVTAVDWIWGAPVFDAGVVYFADATGAVYAVNAVDGSLLWASEVRGSVQTTPTLADGILYIASDREIETKDPIGILTAMSVADGGTILWQQELTVPIFTAPVVVANDVVVAVQSTDSLLIAFDKQTGTRKWDVAPPQASR